MALKKSLQGSRQLPLPTVGTSWSPSSDTRDGEGGMECLAIHEWFLWMKMMDGIMVYSEFPWIAMMDESEYV